jgi:hypothetical protein
MTKGPQFCEKCKQLKPQGRDLVGVGWIICLCDHEKAKKEIDLKKKMQLNMLNPNRSINAK